MFHYKLNTNKFIRNTALREAFLILHSRFDIMRRIKRCVCVWYEIILRHYHSNIFASNFTWCYDLFFSILQNAIRQIFVVVVVFIYHLLTESESLQENLSSRPWLGFLLHQWIQYKLLTESWWKRNRHRVPRSPFSSIDLQII